MIDLRWLSDRLCDVLRWQLANPGKDDGPDVPIAGQRVWSIFLELNRARTGGMGPNPIATGEIEAWSRMRREPVRPFEMTMLRAPGKMRRRPLGAAVTSARPMSVDLFDAVFGRWYGRRHQTISLPILPVRFLGHIRCLRAFLQCAPCYHA